VSTIDKMSLLAELEGPMLLADAEAELRAEGLTLDAKIEPMTVAHWIARGAPGSRDAWLDPADHLIAGLDGTLKSGTVIRVRPAPRRAVGPDLIALFLGAHGRYGTVDRAWVRVHRVGIARPTSTPFIADRNPAVTASEEALFTAIARELLRA
jgi:alkyldihydroxyacetonephosphate synthase